MFTHVCLLTTNGVETKDVAGDLLHDVMFSECISPVRKSSLVAGFKVAAWLTSSVCLVQLKGGPFYSCRIALSSGSLSVTEAVTELLSWILFPSMMSLEEPSGDVRATLEKDMLTWSFSSFSSFRL